MHTGNSFKVFDKE